MVNLSTRALNYDIIVYTRHTTSGTSAGASVGGTWNIRTLDTVQFSNQSYAWSSLASSVITLQPGTYLIETSAPVFDSNRHITRFWNITDSVAALTGTAEYCEKTDEMQTRSFLSGVITVDSVKTFRLEHWIETSTGTFGLGVNNGFTTNAYALVKIIKLK